MSETELRGLLEAATPEPPSLMNGPVLRGYVRRASHRKLLPALAAACSVVLALIVASIQPWSDTAKPAATGRGIVMQGVIVELPDGWTRRTSACGVSQPYTLSITTLSEVSGMSCPLIEQRFEGPALGLHPIYEDQGAWTWSGTLVRWKGHSAYKLSMPILDGVRVTLVVPALNAWMTSVAADLQAAEAVLDLVRPAPRSDRPEVARVTVLAPAATLGRDHRVRSSVVLTGDDAQSLVTEIFDEPVGSEQACAANWDIGALLLDITTTTDEHRYVAIRPDTACQQAYTVDAVRSVSTHLRERLADLLPFDGSNVPDTVLAVAAQARRDAGGVPVRVVWVRTTWGAWRTAEGQEPGPHADALVDIVQARGDQSWTCPSCKGLSAREGTVATYVTGVHDNNQLNEFAFGDSTFRVPQMKGAIQLGE